MGKISVDKKKLASLCSKFFSKAVTQLTNDSQAMIADDRWQWPRQTKRSNGDVVNSPRDIVDTGELFDSLVIAQNGNNVELTWDSDYAIAVHEGATTSKGTELPARKWIDATIEETTAGKVFERSVLRDL